MGYDGQAAAAMLRKYNVSYNTMSAMQIKAAKFLLQHGVFVFVFQCLRIKMTLTHHLNETWDRR